MYNFYDCANISYLIFFDSLTISTILDFLFLELKSEVDPSNLDLRGINFEVKTMDSLGRILLHKDDNKTSFYIGAIILSDFVNRCESGIAIYA